MAKKSEMLRISKEFCQTIVETLPDGIYQVDSSGKLIFVNESFTTLFGYRREELLGKHFADMLSAETLSKVEKMVREVLSGKNVRDEVTVKHKDGHEIPVRFSATPLKEQGEIVGLTGVLSDITERKQAEELLRESEERFRAIFEQAADSIMLIDAESGEVVDFNDRACENIGYSPKEFRRLKLTDFEVIESAQEVAEHLRRVVKHGTDTFETKHRRKGGEIRDIQVSVRALSIRGRDFIQGIWRDITERKQAEKALWEREELFRALIENSSDAISILNADGTLRYVSISITRILGYEPGETIGKTSFELVHPDDMPNVTDSLAQLLQNPGGTVQLEVRVMHKDGSWHTLELVATNHLADPVIAGIIVNQHDITERKQAEEALREAHDKLEKRVKERTLELEKASEALQVEMGEHRRAEEAAKGMTREFLTILENSVDMIYRLNLQYGTYDYLSPSSEIVLGYTPEEFIASGFEHASSLVHPDDLEMLSKNILELIEHAPEQTATGPIEYRMNHKQLGYRWVSDNRSIIYDDRNMPVAAIGILRDVTDRKQAEQALQESERKYRELADLLPQIVFEIDAEGNFTFANRKGFESTSYSQDDFDKGLNIFQLLVPEDRERGQENLQGMLSGEESTGTEYTALRKDGTTFPIVVYSSLIIRDNQPAGLRAVAIDITERKRGEKALRESEEKYRQVVERAHDGIAIVQDDIIKYVNPHFTEMLGYAPDEMIGTPMTNYISTDEIARGVEYYERRMAGEQFESEIEIGLLHKNGSRVDVEVNAGLAIYEGRPADLAMIRDITQRKRAEEALRESEEKLRIIFDTVGVGITITDMAGTIVGVNETTLRMKGYSSKEEVIGLNGFDFVAEKDRTRALEGLKGLVEDEVSTPIEIALLTKDGRELDTECSSTILRDSSGNAVGLINVERDIAERKQAEEALRQSEERYRAIVENIRDVIWTTDEDLRYTYLSPTIMRQRGYSVEEAMALGPEDILTPASLEVVLKAFTSDAAADNGERNELIKPRPLELEAYCKDGSTIWTETEATYLRDSDGQIIGTIGVTRDINERKRAEEALRISEHKFRDLTETTPDWVWEVDENGMYTYISPNVEQLLGYKVDEVLGKTPFDLMPQEEAEKIGRIFEELVTKRDQIHRLENINRHRDGHLVVLETNGIPFFDEEGKFKGYRGIDRDITERKRAEEALREREEHFQALIENSLEAIAIIDREGAIQYLGPSFESLMGYELEEYLGKSPFDHVHPDDRSRVAAIFAELTQKPGAIVQEEVRVLHKNGSLRTVEVVGQNLLHNPAVGGVVANMRDITERKQAAEKLQALYQQEKDLREQIEKEMKRRVEFTRVLAHELKTPLTSVLASSELLVSEVPDEPLLSLAKNIRQGASNLNSRIDELLDLARGEVGMLQLKREPVDLSHLLREAADSMTPLAFGHGQSLILRLPPALPMVQADTTRLQQIVTNLLNNAVKFTPKGGSITLRARKKDASVIVEVQDTGRGIPKKEQERLFEPYQRLEEDEENLSGLGLGLSLCKTLVELHGGQIWVRSHVGRGSTFGFSLPLETADRQATEPEKIAKLWKVLIIEDDQQIVDSVSLTFRLRWPEAQLISTGLGEEGIEMVETEAPDTVILDLGLPDISGFDVLRQIRLFSSVPVVILTVREDESDMVKGLEWGADDYLVKPFKQLELLARLKVQLRKQTLPDEEAPIVCGPLRLEPSTFQLIHDGKEISLTIIEGRIIECLMRNAGHVVTHSRLAETVWGEDYPRALDSLRVYIRYLREKLEANPSKPKIILTKAGVGYSLAKPV